mgnify:CR=1 FL=1|jgi:hypothetical protein
MTLAPLTASLVVGVDVANDRLNEGLGRRFVLRPTALIIGRQVVAKVLPCFLLDQ